MTFQPMGNWGSEVSLTDIEALPTPERLGIRHNPIEHARLLETTRRCFDMANYELTEWKYLLSNDKQRMLAGFEIKHKDLPNYAEWSFTGAIMTSTNSTLSARLLFGQTVAVCDNGCIWAEHVLRHKHTFNAPTNLKYMIMDKIENLTTITSDIHRSTEIMKQIPMNDAKVHDFLVQSCKRDVLKWQHAPLVLDQWNDPDYEDFKPRTQWSLFNAYTHVWKKRNQFELSARSSKLIDHQDRWNNTEFVGTPTNDIESQEPDQDGKTRLLPI